MSLNNSVDIILVNDLVSLGHFSHNSQNCLSQIIADWSAHCSHPHALSLPHWWLVHLWIALEVLCRKSSFGSHAVRNEDLKQMISDFIMFMHLLNGSTNNSLFFLENPDCTKDFGISMLLVFKVLQSSGHLSLTFLVENDLERSWIVANIEHCSHWLFKSIYYSSNYDNIIDCFSINFANIIWSWLSILNHFQGDRYKDLWLSSCVCIISSLLSGIYLMTGNKESLVVVWKLYGFKVNKR